MVEQSSLTLRGKIILLVVILLAAVMTLVSLLFHQMVTATIEEEHGRNALNLAKTVATIPAIREAFATEEPSRIIQPIAEAIRLQTGAEFIVVGNTRGIRYSHPVPNRLGQPMVGGDNDRALLWGESYVSTAIGTLGPSLRGKAPIRDDKGEIIGIVSVGFLMEEISSIQDRYDRRILLITMLGLAVGILGAVVLAWNVKRQILGLEPREIAALFHERNAILESIHEGIIAVDQQGKVTVVNRAAKQMLPGGADFAGRPVTEVLPHTRLLEVLATGESQFDREMIIGKDVAVVNRIPILDGKQVVGAVASFRDKSEIDRLAHELSEVRRYAEALRAQAHEFTNKLYTISGLIQLDRQQEALAYISAISDDHQDLVAFLMKELPDVMIGAIILGKRSRASELGIAFRINRESSLYRIPPHLDRQLLVTIIGNLVENAFDAVTPGQGWVELFVTDIGEDIIIEVEDNGSGVPAEIAGEIFQEGVSSKANHSGIGLALVRRALLQMGGSVTFRERAEGGTLFTVIIPKTETGEKEAAYGDVPA